MGAWVERQRALGDRALVQASQRRVRKASGERPKRMEAVLACTATDFRNILEGVRPSKVSMGSRPE
eukprot:11770213-Alexandrium_andersonii.AAC.1